MGSNYYVDLPADCGDPAHGEQLHIGKSSLGWKFAFHGIPERGLMSWAAWLEFLGDDGSSQPRVIVDEYGDPVTLADFVRLVESKQTRPRSPFGGAPFCRVDPSPECREVGFGGRWQPWESEFHDAAGYDFATHEFS